MWIAIAAGLVVIVAVFSAMLQKKTNRIRRESITSITRHEKIDGQRIMARNGWIRVDRKRTREDLEDAMRLRAAKVGANGIVKFYWHMYEHKRQLAFCGEAEAVTLEANQNTGSKPAKTGKVRPDIPVFIDGSNLIYWSDAQKISPVPLRELCDRLRKLNVGFLVHFDANIKFLLKEAGHLVDPTMQSTIDLEMMFGLDRNEIDVVPGGTQADAFILQRADISKGVVISNDRYRDYQDKFAWIKNPARVHRGGISGGHMYIPTLDLKVAVSG